MEFSISQILVTAIGSIGGLSGLVTAGAFLNKYINERRKAREEKDAKRIHESIEGRRLELEHSEKKESAAIENVWKLVAAKEKDNERLELELEECEKNATLSRPTITKVYRNLRAMRKEIESLNLMILNEEETNVFMRRFQTVKELLDDTENILP